jgi:hypothetical protein
MQMIGRRSGAPAPRRRPGPQRGQCRIEDDRRLRKAALFSLIHRVFPDPWTPQTRDEVFAGAPCLAIAFFREDARVAAEIIRVDVDHWRAYRRLAP